MSNKLAKMQKQQQKANSYDFTKGGKVYGRVTNPITPQEASNETWKISYRVFMEVALETLEQKFQFGAYMRNEFVKAFSEIHQREAGTGPQAEECMKRCEERPETDQLFER